MSVDTLIVNTFLLNIISQLIRCVQVTSLAPKVCMDSGTRLFVHISVISDVKEVIPVLLLPGSSAVSTCLAAEGKRIPFTILS